MNTIVLKGDEVYTLVKRFNERVWTDKIGRKYQKFTYKDKYKFAMYEPVVEAYDKGNIIELSLSENVSIKGKRVYGYAGHLTKELAFLIEEHENKINKVRGVTYNQGSANSIKLQFGTDVNTNEQNKE